MKFLFGVAWIVTGIALVARSGSVARRLRAERWPFKGVPVLRVMNQVVESRPYVVSAGLGVIALGIAMLIL